MPEPELPAVGVEEEYQLVDRVSGKLIPDCKKVMRNLRKLPQAASSHAEIQHELHLNQIEMASEVCQTLDEVRRSLIRTRRLLIESSDRSGVALAAAGTNPLAVPAEPALTPKDRYRAMTERFQQIARDLFIFGCHVHVTMEDRELGVEVMNGVHRWLPMLQALSANSPFWDGHDTGYASYRRELWVQWPMAGPPPHFEGLADYERCIEDLVRTTAIQDESFIYWDVRLPTRVPTIEFRGADVMTSIDDVVGYVGLIRAIVMQTKADVLSGRSSRRVRPTLLSFALWQAARYGVGDMLVDPLSCEKLPASDYAGRMLETVAPSLDLCGDRELVEAFVQRVVESGNGADRQRWVAERANVASTDKMYSADVLSAVVSAVVDETARGTMELADG